MSTDEDTESNGGFQKNRILHSGNSSKKNSKNKIAKTFENMFNSDNSSQSSKKSLLGKSTEKAFKKEFKTSRTSHSRASLFLPKSLRLSKDSPEKICSKENIVKLSSKKTNPKHCGKISHSLNSLGCSSTLSEFSSPISSFSSASTESITQISKKDSKKLPTIQKCILSKDKNLNKLKDLIGLLNGTLIKDYSDLLVDHEHRFILSDDMNEDSLQSLLTDSSSTDLTDGTSAAMNKLLKTDINFGPGAEKLVEDEEKMLKVLISILVKSCRIFDVATTKTDSKLSYWRYANPVIAVLKYNKKRMVCGEKWSVASQTEDVSGTSVEKWKSEESRPIVPMYENQLFFKLWYDNPIYENVVGDKICRTEPCVYENSDFLKKLLQPEATFKIEEKSGQILSKVNCRVHDETLRDAENMFDVESDWDKCSDWRDQKQDFFLINNKNVDWKAWGHNLDERKNGAQKIINPEIGHKSKPFRKNSILSLSWSSSSSSINLKRPKSTNNDNDCGHYKKSRSTLKTNSNAKWFSGASRSGQQGCLYKKDKNRSKIFNFIHIDKKKSSLAKTTAPSNNLSNRSAQRLCSIMHEYQNRTSLETFLRKYESQSLSFKSETSMSAPLARTHSLDSLEEEKHEHFTIECADAADDQKAKKTAYSIGDLKDSAKFNEQSLVKQRARESLKFWKTEEEKLKQDTDQQSPSPIVQNSIFSSPNPFVSSLKRVTSRDSAASMHRDLVTDEAKEKSAEMDQQVPAKRVKDRINIFETKFQENKTSVPATKIKKGSQSNFAHHEARPLLLDSTDTFQTKLELKSELKAENLKNEELCSQSYIETNDDETVTSTKIIEFVQNVNESEPKSDSCDSDKNMYEETFFENQIIEYKCEKTDGHIKISTCSLDKQKTINLSLNSISSEYVLENEQQVVECDAKSLTNAEAKSESDASMDKQSSSSMHSVTKSDESEEEVEIVIDLNGRQEAQKRRCMDEEKIDEVLRNIVMHLVPTTRKAYVDDIVDGIKSQLGEDELDAIESPLDLPRDLIRFVQKRYSNLLSENMQAEKLQAKHTSLEIVVDSDRDSVYGKCGFEDEQQEETTELTVVKEDVGQMGSGSQSKLICDENNFVKVDEETLYIVEKIRQIKNQDESQGELVVRSNSTVENEIRKNFELKPKFEQNLNKIKKDTDLKILSIFKSNLHFGEMHSHGLINEINDYQLHYFDVESGQQASMLVILFDKQNEDNLKYNLEQNYQKSIVDTHLSLNRKANINIVAHLNLYYIDDIDSDCSLKEDFCESHASYINLVNNSKFYDFSIFKRLRDAHQLSHLTDVSTYFLPIGKYFVKVYYKHVIHTNDLVLNQVINETRTEKESIIDLSLLPLAIRAQLICECQMFLDQKPPVDLPQVNILAVDSFLLQMEINKKRDDLIRNIIVQNLNYTRQQAEEFLTKKKSFNQMENLNEFISRLEADLDSYYICEKVDSLTKEDQAQRSNEDLVKLNKLDALASFKCVQKYQLEMVDVLSHSKFKYQKSADTYQKFYLIDNGNHYKCLLPSEDLADLADGAKMDIEDKSMSNSSIFMENIQKRQNYIFDKDLQNVFTTQSSGPSEKKSEKKSEKNEPNLRKNGAKVELNGANVDSGKLESNDLRQQIISNQVYKMFASIRHHQSSTTKAKGEMNVRRKKKYATWSYSSEKRHVIAKVMELPYADDMSILSKKTGISDLKDLEKSILNSDEDACEKVFVRIDDFLNKQVSQSIQRSYSYDYLNKNAGPKHRIKYVKIPNQGLKSFSLPCDLIPQASEYRTAPYDLRYLSILKLLEEERLSQAKSSDSINANKHNHSNTINLVKTKMKILLCEIWMRKKLKSIRKKHKIAKNYFDLQI
ncbi:hypothetical protein BpHYR1_031328 [Brachionus plicatilis]|uniref:Uncharacterized protein n=1 Tax=Brachionus plicatilis TaxID=10195 RepID=A0A3M7QS91_BRAPC|nr:hypothetical protein BpHYR1_031328 [Brachionus plicatilis]